MNEKGTNEVERKKTINAIIVLVLLLILLGVVIGLIISQNSLVDYGKIKEELFKSMGYTLNKVDALPELTSEERESYEQELAEDYDEIIETSTQIIKKKHPNFSDSEAITYANKFIKHIKEDMFRILKFNRELAESSKDAVENSNKANAESTLAIKYAEVLADFYKKNPPEQSYKVNEQDLKILQQFVLEKTDGEYTVKITEDNSAYDLVKVSN